MTADEISRLAVRHGAPVLHQNEQREYWRDAPSHYLREGSTSFVFWLNEAGLEWFRQQRDFSIKGLRVSLRRNLCTGEHTGYPRIRVYAPPELRGATLELDGTNLGGFSTGEGPAFASIGVPILGFGNHELRIVKHGFEPLLRRFTYAPQNFWPEVEDLVFEIQLSELRRAG